MRKMKNRFSKSRIRSEFIFIICWFIGTALFAQENIDTELWTGATFELQLNEKFRA